MCEYFNTFLGLFTHQTSQFDNGLDFSTANCLLQWSLFQPPFFPLQELVDSGVSHLTEAIVSLDSYLLAARRHSIELSNTVSGKSIHT